MSKSFKETLKKPSKNEKKIVAVRMPDDLDQELNKIAKQKKMSVSKVIIEALRYALDLQGKK